VKQIKYKRRTQEEKEVAFCRICYTRGAGRPAGHLSMEADTPEAALRGVAAIFLEYVKRTGDSIDEVNYALLRECDRLESKGA